MKNFEGVWLPDKEAHLVVWMTRSGLHKRDGFPTYQYKKYQAALKWVKHRRLAIDIGSFVGQWSRVMAMDFGMVQAFEPVELYRDCWVRNMEGFTNAQVTPVALGAGSGSVTMVNYTKGSFGDTSVRVNSVIGNVVGTAAMTTLDNYDFYDVDLIKIDCEGFEKNVIEGALRTLEQKPTIIIEQKKNKDAVPILKDLGAIERDVISGDHIFSWD